MLSQGCRECKHFVNGALFACYLEENWPTEQLFPMLESAYG